MLKASKFSGLSPWDTPLTPQQSSGSSLASGEGTAEISLESRGQSQQLEERAFGVWMHKWGTR